MCDKKCKVIHRHGKVYVIYARTAHKRRQENLERAPSWPVLAYGVFLPSGVLSRTHLSLRHWSDSCNQDFATRLVSCKYSRQGLTGKKSPRFVTLLTQITPPRRSSPRGASGNCCPPDGVAATAAPSPQGPPVHGQHACNLSCTRRVRSVRWAARRSRRGS